MTDHSADIEAQLRFYTTAEGGRKTPCRSGSSNPRHYRPQCDLGRTDGWNDALFEFIDKESVFPGDSVTTKMWFLRPELQAERLYEGFKFTVHEGHRAVADGTVTRVLNEALRKKPEDGGR